MRSIKVTKEIKGELKEGEYKKSFYSKAIDAFYSLAALYVRKGEGVKAFNICEEAKAQNLVELIGARDITPKLERTERGQVCY